MPMRDTRYAGTPLRLLPLNDQSPSSGRSNPVNRLKKVVFPAPLGPISPVITPRWISTCSTSTAVRPPNVRRMPSTTRIGSDFFDPGSRSASLRAARLLDVSTSMTCSTSSISVGIECQLPSVSEDALWSEDHQEHQGQSHEDEPHQAGLVAVHDGFRDERVGARRG